jgi:hypothetical protein
MKLKRIVFVMIFFLNLFSINVLFAEDKSNDQFLELSAKLDAIAYNGFIGNKIDQAAWTRWLESNGPIIKSVLSEMPKTWSIRITPLITREESLDPSKKAAQRGTARAKSVLEALRKAGIDTTQIKVSESYSLHDKADKIVFFLEDPDGC